eukprot:TRINITY_DN7378_c0_g3_i1.p2 TRINITY_DN7378_c0_g3~~TRINITY_DN7378_c0_g3_i1.p2  ORF type:complete len:159 (+),score=46.31 TRINITY_DN7378_c0_g3_i1:66-542(+)
MLAFLLAPITFLLVTIYAPAMSIKSLKDGKITKDDVHWLAFWVAWSVLNGLETATFGLFFLIPFYAEAKFAVLVYMLFFDGAKAVFEKAIDPLLVKLLDHIPAEYIEKLEQDPKAFIMEVAHIGKAFAVQKANDMKEKANAAKESSASEGKNKKSKGK